MFLIISKIYLFLYRTHVNLSIAQRKFAPIDRKFKAYKEEVDI